MKCVVTGGAGFIGSHVVSALRGAGHAATVVDIAGGEGIIEVDICDVDPLADLFETHGGDAVFHIAAIADARKALADPVKAVQINIGGTASVLEAARRAGVGRVILASTCWVCNAMEPGLLTEESPFVHAGGQHVYTTTKIASEMLAHDFHHLYGLPFTILRYGIPYGPRMWRGLVLRNFIERATSGQPLQIYGDGSATRNFVYVGDLAEAHVLALQEIAENQVYNLEGMRSVQIRELANLVVKLLPESTIQYIEEPKRIGEFKHFRRVISNAKAHVELGWEPKTDLEEGVRRTIDWYKGGGKVDSRR